MDRAKQVIVDFAIQYGFQVVGALVILVVGVFVAKAAGEALMRGLMKREMEPPVRTRHTGRRFDRSNPLRRSAHPPATECPCPTAKFLNCSAFS